MTYNLNDKKPTNQLIPHILIIEDEDGKEIVHPMGKMRHENNPIRPSQQKKMPGGGVPWRVVEMENVPPYDSEIFGRVGPEYIIHPQKVVEKWFLEPHPAAEQIIEHRVNMMAELKREIVLEDEGIPTLQLQEYIFALQQAHAAQDLAVEESRQILDGEFPMLDASVGVTINPRTENYVESPLEAARVIIEKEKLLQTRFARIRKARLQLKKLVRGEPNIFKKIKLLEEADSMDGL